MASVLARVSVDAFMLVVALAATLLGSRGSDVPVAPAVWLGCLGVLVLGFSWLRGGYESRQRLDVLHDVWGVVVVTSLATLVTFALRGLVTDATFEAAEVVRPWAFAAAYVAAGRIALQWSQLVGGAPLQRGVVTWDDIDDAVGSRPWELIRRWHRTDVVKRRGWLIRRALMIADVLALSLAFVTSQWVFGAAEEGFADPGARTEVPLFLLSLPLWIIAAKAYRLYERDDERTDHTTFDDAWPVLHLVTLGTWLFFAGTWAGGLGQPDFGKLALFWISAIVLVIVARSVARMLCRRNDLYHQKTVIVGAGEIGQLVARKFLQHPEYGVKVVGFVDDAPRDRDLDVQHLPLLGAPDTLPGIVTLHDVDRVVVAFSNESHPKTLSLIRSLHDLDVKIDIVPRLFEVLGPSATLHGVGGLALVGLPPLHLSRASRAVKRAIDLLLSIAGLFVMAPLFGAIAIAIKFTSPGPVFFRQTRMGAGDRTFEMFKFRSMTVDADRRKAEFGHLNKHNGRDSRMFKIADDPRVTSVGRFLRRYSLDELPQLLNVVRGEMTLVGPRPLILEEDQHVREWARKRLDLKPGITGQWQTLGRSDIPFAEMIKLDYLYVTNWSPWRDVKLMLQTIPAVMRSRSVVY
jgi:exopolysaccharide biosynthesis polyprenyl glycosylphosphotransferase